MDCIVSRPVSPHARSTCNALTISVCDCWTAIRVALAVKVMPDDDDDHPQNNARKTDVYPSRKSRTDTMHLHFPILYSDRIYSGEALTMATIMQPSGEKVDICRLPMNLVCIVAENKSKNGSSLEHTRDRSGKDRSYSDTFA